MNFHNIYAGAYAVDVEGRHFFCVFRNGSELYIVNYGATVKLTPDRAETAARIRESLGRCAGGKRFTAQELATISEGLTDAAKIIYPVNT